MRVKRDEARRNRENEDAQVTILKVSGWGVYCCDFLLLPVVPSLSCSCVHAPNTRSNTLPPSPAVSYCLPMSTTRLSLLLNPPSQVDYDANGP